MSRLRFRISISLDGLVAGPNQSEENPLGEGGEALHEWAIELAAWRKPHGREGGEVNASSEVMERGANECRCAADGTRDVRWGPGSLA